MTKPMTMFEREGQEDANMAGRTQAPIEARKELKRPKTKAQAPVEAPKELKRAKTDA